MTARVPKGFSQPQAGPYITASGTVFSDASLTYNPYSLTYQPFSDMFFDLTLPSTTLVLFGWGTIEGQSHNVHQLFDNGVAISEPIYSLFHSDSPTGKYVNTGTVLVRLGAGVHHLTLQHHSTSGTASTTFVTRSFYYMVME